MQRLESIHFLCLQRNSHSYLCYGIDRSHQQRFVARSTLSIISDKNDDLRLSNQQDASWAAIIDFVWKSVELEKHFSQKCKEVLSPKKKRGKHRYFRLLENPALFALWIQAVNESVEIMYTKKNERSLSKTV